MKTRNEPVEPGNHFQFMLVCQSVSVPEATGQLTIRGVVDHIDAPLPSEVPIRVVVGCSVDAAEIDDAGLMLRWVREDEAMQPELESMVYPVLIDRADRRFLSIALSVPVAHAGVHFLELLDPHGIFYGPPSVVARYRIEVRSSGHH